MCLSVQKVVIFSCLTVATSVIAKENESIQSDELFEVITVTANKRVESIQEVPVSVSVLSGDQIDAFNLSDTTDITQQIPNFQLNAWSPQLTTFNLRGVSQNNFVDNLEAPIAVYQDESYVSSMNAISGQLFDIERVEVLRGPQGTLFGRNATGGLVHYISRTASEDELNGYFDASISSYNRQSIEGAIGGSLSDSVRGRIAFRHETADGYIEPMNIDGVVQRAIGGADGYGIRAILAVDFTQNLIGEFIAKWSQDDDVPTGAYLFENCSLDEDGFCLTDQYGRAITTEGVASDDPHTHMSNTRGFLNRDIQNYTAKFTYLFQNSLELTAISNFMRMDKSYLEDGDALPESIVIFGQDMKFDQFSQELRLAENTEKLKWQVGLYYMDAQQDADALTIGGPNIDLSFDLYEAGIISQSVIDDDFPFDGRSDRKYLLDVTNTSIFAQIDYNILEATTLTAGLRFIKDEKEVNWVAFFSSDQQLSPIAYAASENSQYADNPTILNRYADDEISYSDVAARLSLKKDFTDSVMGFVAWNRGVKGGNWTLSSGVSPERFQHDEEVLNAFEVGFKSQFDNDLRVNATAYYYDYQDYQTFIALPSGAVSPNPQIGNSDAKAYGAEIEMVYRPTNNFNMAFGIALNDSKVAKIEAGNLPITNSELPNAPAFSGNYLFRYYLTNFSAGEVAIQFDGAFYGDQYLEVTNGPGTEQSAYNVSNLSVSWLNEDWTVSFWAKNVFDETYKVYSLDLGALGVTSYYGAPFTSGVSVRFDF